MENFNKIIDDLKDQSSELIKISMKKWKDVKASQKIVAIKNRK